MKMLVCFKVIADFSMLSKNDWHPDNDLQIDFSYVRKMINPFDESALEIALRLKQERQSRNLETHLTALTIADKEATLFLDNTLALSYKEAVLIEKKREDDLRFSPEIIAKAIAAFAKQEGFDLILFGIEEGEGNCGQVSAFAAEKLNLPYISPVAAIKTSDVETQLLLERSIYSGNELWQVKTPFVAAIGNTSEGLSLRMPTLKEKILAKERKAKVLPLADFVTEADFQNAPRLRALTQTAHERKIQWLKGDVEAQAQALSQLWESRP